MKSRQDFESDLDWTEYLQQYYAGLAMQGILANHWCQNHFKNELNAIEFKDVAEQSIRYADALIRQLNKN